MVHHTLVSYEIIHFTIKYFTFLYDDSCGCWCQMPIQQWTIDILSIADPFALTPHYLKPTAGDTVTIVYLKSLSTMTIACQLLRTYSLLAAVLVATLAARKDITVRYVSHIAQPIAAISICNCSCFHSDCHLAFDVVDHYLYWSACDLRSVLSLHILLTWEGVLRTSVLELLRMWTNWCLVSD